MIGMLQVASVFEFFSDEVHLFVDSLWSVDHTLSAYTPDIKNIYNDYLRVHYPDRGGHPNGIALLMGSLMWILSFFNEVNRVNLPFFVWAIRLLLIIAFLISLLFLYLLLREMDEIYGKKIGKISVIISAMFPPLIAYGSIRAMDTMSLLFMMISLWSFIRLLKSPKPTLMTWLMPGISAGIFFILKISGPLIIIVLIIYSIILAGKGNWKEVSKRMMITCSISLLILIVTNNPYLYSEVLFFPTSAEFHSVIESDDIRKFGFVGFQMAKLWEFFHPDYYHYLGYHRHGGPNLQILGLINKYFTFSFLLLYIVSFVILLIFRKWKELLLFNAPFFLLLLSLPNLQVYRLLPVFPLWLATIAFALLIIWDRYPKTFHKVIVAFLVTITIFIFPAYSFIDNSVVKKDIYLDLGDVAARNRHLYFERGIFYDRHLRNFRAYQLGIPFCLIPRKDGIVREKLIFKETGEYFVDLLLGTTIRDDNFIMTIKVRLGDMEYIIAPNDSGWTRTGPFSIRPNTGENELTIDIQGIKYNGNKGVNVLGIHDIRVVKNDSSANNGKPPLPWWMQNHNY